MAGSGVLADALQMNRYCCMCAAPISSSRFVSACADSRRAGDNLWCDCRSHWFDAGCGAVGQAVGSNPLAMIIPCHRVINGSGVVGHYRGGAPRKRALLAWEAALQRRASQRLMSQGRYPK